MNTRFLFYKQKSTFDADKSKLNDNQIAFIAETLTIYTHGVEFNCFSENTLSLALNNLKFRLLGSVIQYSIDNGKTWETLIDLNSVDWTKVTNLTLIIQNIVNQNVDLSEIEKKIATINTTLSNHNTRITNLENNGGSGSGGGGSDYTLPTASDKELGGIKIGFPQANKNYPVQLDSQSRAFVNVPWTSGSGGGSTTGGDTVSYKQIGPTEYKIGELTINGIINSIYGKNASGSGSEGGSGGVTEDWVNEKILDAINSIKDLIGSSGVSSEKQTLSWWNENLASGNIDENTIYVITDDTGNVVLGIGVRGILTRIPVAANTVVRCTQSEYDSINPKDPNTIYIITSDDGNTILKMYLGSIQIPFGEDSNVDEIIIKSIITQMFSEKITWTEDGKIDKINWTMLDVDNPGEFYATTGLEKIVDGAISVKTSGFLAKSSEDATFASMFAAQVNEDGIAKKAEIIASINEDKSNVQISADKVNIVGNESFIAAVGSVVDNKFTGAGFVTKNEADSAYASMLAFTDLSDNVVKNASIIASINASGESNVTISADKIDVDGVLNAGKINADNITSGSIKSANVFVRDSNYDVNRPNYPWIVGGMVSTEHDTDYALWIGSSIDGDGLTDEEILTDVFNEDTSEIPFKVTRTGKLYAKDAEISGDTSVSGKIHAKSLYLGEGSVFIMSSNSHLSLEKLSLGESRIIYAMRKPFPNLDSTTSYYIGATSSDENIRLVASVGLSSTTGYSYEEIQVKSDVMCVGHNDDGTTLWRIYELSYAGTPNTGGSFGQ